MGKKVIVIIIAVLLVAAAVLVYLFVIAPKLKAEPVEIYYSTGDAFITNVKETESTLLKTTCQLVICRDETEKLTEKNAQVRDTVLRVLRSCSEEVLKAPEAQETLSQAICEELNRVFASMNTNKKGETLEPLFTRVLFTDLLMQ